MRRGPVRSISADRHHRDWRFGNDGTCRLLFLNHSFLPNTLPSPYLCNPAHASFLRLCAIAVHQWTLILEFWFASMCLLPLSLPLYLLKPVKKPPPCRFLVQFICEIASFFHHTVLFFSLLWDDRLDHLAIFITQKDELETSFSTTAPTGLLK